MKKTRIKVKVSALQLNTGQLGWLPKNPRQWTQEDIDKMCESLRRDPDFMEDNPLDITPAPQEGQFVVFCGNLRTTGLGIVGVEETDAYLYIPEKKPDPDPACHGKSFAEDRETIRRRAILDNGHFGSWDSDTAAEWGYEAADLAGFGVPGYVYGNAVENPGGAPGEEGDSAGKEKPAIPEGVDVESLLNEAMRENVREALEQIDYTMQRGWLSSFFTRGVAQAKFIRAKFLGEHYPQYISLYFCPERFFTSANTRSLYEQFRKIADGEDAGIAGLRTISSDGLLLLLKGSYPFGGARMPMDFPANKARELIEEFAGAGASVLDPCHGWGGRLCGALMADVALYVGVDPSPEAHAGVERMADAFLPYSPSSKVEFIQAPFEDADLGGRTFDFALTSPPYFDVEQYHGEGQSHVRYPEYGKWVQGFLEPLIRKTHNALKPGGVFALQVGSQSYPILDEVKRISPAAGFTIVDIRPLGGGTSSALYNNTDEDEENEKIVILRKREA